MPAASGRPARDSVGVAALISERIGSGGFRVGHFLPPVRSLAGELGVSRETVRRAVKLLEGRRVLEATARHGVRVMRKPRDAEKLTPAAYVMFGLGASWQGTGQLLHGLLQNAAAAHGFTLTGISAGDRGVREVGEQLGPARLGGMIVSADDPGILAELGRLGLPMVVVEAPSPEGRFDSIIQDGFGGGVQAADHLAGRGHRRIGWVGPVAKSFQSMQRWGGAVAGLKRHGLELDPRLTIDSNAEEDPVGRIEAALAGPDRPTGLIALWRAEAVAAGRAAARLGLRIGRDLDIVGWTAEEAYSEYVNSFPEGQLPATITWPTGAMAEAALARLAERLRRPKLPTMRMVVETRLRTPD